MSATSTMTRSLPRPAACAPGGFRAPEPAPPMAASARRSVFAGDKKLTKREREVLQHLSYGKTTDEIAVAMDLTGDTIRTHLGRMYAKANSANRAAMVAIGFRGGLLVPRPYPAESRRLVQLDERLRELLPLIAAGYTDQQIGRLMVLTPGGVKDRMKRLRRELGAPSRVYLVRLAVEAGLLHLGPIGAEQPGGAA